MGGYGKSNYQSGWPLYLKQLGELALIPIVALCIAIVVLILAGVSPWAAISALVKGSVGSWLKFGHVVKTWIPLTMCGLGLLYTFRVGLWNIGVEGQVMIGAVFATWMLRQGVGSENGSLFVTLAIMAAIIGGGLWAMIAGVLKTAGGVNEIFAGLGMNFVAQGAILWLVFGPWKRPGVASMSGTEVFPQQLWLSLVSIMRVPPLGIALVLVALVITAIILGNTLFGLRLKAVGSNSKASLLYGVAPNRYLLSAIFISGALAGVAGCLQVSGIYHRLLPAISSSYGYLALMVVMLSGDRVWAVPVIALFFACLNVGSIQLPMMLKIDSSLSGVIQGTLVLSALAVLAWRKSRAELPATDVTASAVKVDD